MSEQATVAADDGQAGEIRWLGDLARLDVKPGDVLVLMHPMRLSQTAQINIAATLKHLLPGVKVLVLEEGMRIGVLEQPAGGDA